mmetsp:Transcript_26465/g.60285  ORF Transcript_26465/g.60285 Transcript_26465/m.60285 type:complete len:290 (-) Transcript_26465:106-975(-)
MARNRRVCLLLLLRRARRNCQDLLLNLPMSLHLHLHQFSCLHALWHSHHDRLGLPSSLLCVRSDQVPVLVRPPLDPECRAQGGDQLFLVAQQHSDDLSRLQHHVRRPVERHRLLLLALLRDVEEHVLERRHAQLNVNDAEGLPAGLQLLEEVLHDGVVGVGDVEVHVRLGLLCHLDHEGLLEHLLDLDALRKGLAHVVPAADADPVSSSEARLETDAAADAPQPALGHDADAIAEDVCLLHAVGGQHDASVLLGGFDHIPHVPAVDRVHACRRLVQVDDAGVADEGDGD